MGAGIKMVANNKKAYHDYFIDDKFEAGHRVIRYRGQIDPHG